MTSMQEDDRIAIVGMAGRFPGARNLDELWGLLKSGEQARIVLSDTELISQGVSETLIRNPRYVKSCMKLAQPEYFDAKFFGYSPDQALSIDPQQRLFLECAWETMEAAGYGAASEHVTVGIFGGSSASGHLFENLRRMQAIDSGSTFQCIVDADKDFLTSRVAYKLGLTGPSITVQTACSTSLVATHMACRSLLDYECDLALAGGVSVSIPQETGYLYIEGGTLSADGRCRAFDAHANGTVLGQGVAIVGLRRLKDALASGDEIHAIIRSTVVNNDGARKAGYTAPSPHAQAQLFSTALAQAGLRPQDIGLIEAHGTGTFIGDAIELEALSRVYRTPGMSQFCFLGSIKPNIGHLDTAAGVAGLIKAVLCLKNKVVVPLPNFSEPHPLLEVSDCPFHICTSLRPWPEVPGQPRRAAVSSFGIGGTNAHVIIEEAADQCDDRAVTGEYIFPLSARDPVGLRDASRNLAEYLKSGPHRNLGDVAYTLQVGRRRFECRRTVVGMDRATIAGQLLQAGLDSEGWTENGCADRSVIFMFSGQGAEQPGMIAGLYRTVDTFRQEIDRCAHGFQELLNIDIRRYLCADKANGTERVGSDTLIVQPAIFALEYCLARLLMSMGIKPEAVIGHSIGEYAAACIADILPIESAIQLVAMRAFLTNELSLGGMLVVALSEQRARQCKGPLLDIAAVNSEDQCVLSGELDAIGDCARMLQNDGVVHRVLPAPRAFHSRMMQPAVAKFRKEAEKFAYGAPRVPFVSCVTGDHYTGQAIGPDYWADHLVSTVRFSDGLNALAAAHTGIFLEVGPGTALSGIARRHLAHVKGISFLSCLRRFGDTVKTDLLKDIGSMWRQGADVDWHRCHTGRRPHRVPLPTYPFNRLPYVLPREEHAAAETTAPSAKADLEHWFYLPSWTRSMPLPASAPREDSGAWLVLADSTGLGRAIAERLRVQGHRVILVYASEGYSEPDADSFSMGPLIPASYHRLIGALQARECSVRNIIHCWCLTSRAIERAHALELGYFSALFLSQALAPSNPTLDVAFLCITNEMQEVHGDEYADPAKAALPALCKIIGQEYPRFRHTTVDIPAFDVKMSSPFDYKRYINSLIAEVTQIGAAPVLAYRGNYRLIQSYERVEFAYHAEPVRLLRDQGFYVITGGLGRIGMRLAERLAKQHRARLLLLTRNESFTSEKRIQALEEAGAQVFASNVDLCNSSSVGHAIEQAETRFGKLRGVFHLAADLKHASINKRILDLEVTDLHAQMRPKVIGLEALVEALGERSLDFGVAFSSNSSVLGGYGFGAYAAANAVLDSVVTSLGKTASFPWLVLNWDGWAIEESETGPFTVTVDEGLDALWRAITHCTAARAIISSCPLKPRLDASVRQLDALSRFDSARTTRGTSVALRTALERKVANIWQEVLGGDAIGVEDRFLDVGGDSLIAVRIISRVKEVFSVSIPVAFLITSEATIASLATEIVIQIASISEGRLIDDGITENKRSLG